MWISTVPVSNTRWTLCCAAPRPQAAPPSKSRSTAVAKKSRVDLPDNETAGSDQPRVDHARRDRELASGVGGPASRGTRSPNRSAASVRGLRSRFGGGGRVGRCARSMATEHRCQIRSPGIFQTSARWPPVCCSKTSAVSWPNDRAPGSDPTR